MLKTHAGFSLQPCTPTLPENLRPEFSRLGLGVKPGSLDHEAVTDNACGHLVVALGTAARYPGK